MWPCAARAGMEPVTPTKASEASSSCSRAKCSAIAVCSKNEYCGSANTNVMTAVSSSPMPSNMPEALGTGIAPTRSTSCEPWLMATPRIIASAWTSGSMPSGSCCTIAMRESSGKPKSSKERSSASKAASSAPSDSRSSALETIGGSRIVAATAAPTHATTMNQRRNTTARA